MKISMTIYPDASLGQFENTLRKKIDPNDDCVASYNAMISALRESHQKCKAMYEQGISMNLQREFTVGNSSICIRFSTQKSGLLRRLFAR
jgi:hypothetical protein